MSTNCEQTTSDFCAKGEKAKHGLAAFGYGLLGLTGFSWLAKSPLNSIQAHLTCQKDQLQQLNNSMSLACAREAATVNSDMLTMMVTQQNSVQSNINGVQTKLTEMIGYTNTFLSFIFIVVLSMLVFFISIQWLRS